MPWLALMSYALVMVLVAMALRAATRRDGGDVDSSRAGGVGEWSGDEGVGGVEVRGGGGADHFVERSEVVCPVVDLGCERVDGGVDSGCAFFWCEGRVANAGAQGGVEECSGDADGVGSEGESAEDVVGVADSA